MKAKAKNLKMTNDEFITFLVTVNWIEKSFKY
jgi:hypothetical protein